MLIKHGNKERGDTLVEVLLAIAVLSMVMVSAIVLMSRGQAVATNSLERSQVQARINEQGSLLQYIRDAYSEVMSAGQTPQAGTAAELWQTIQTAHLTNPNNDVCDAGGSPNQAPDSFFLSFNPAPATNPVSLATYTGAAAPLAPIPGQGMWIEAQASGGGVSQPYVDFFIKACWRPAGSGTSQESKNVVRLYAP